MKTVMVIPGAYAQIPLIKNLKLQGYKVVCVNPYENSPAFEYADYSEQFDIMDVENCIVLPKNTMFVQFCLMSVILRCHQLPQ